MKNKYIHQLIQKFFHSELPSELQTKFRSWFLHLNNSDELDTAMRELWDAERSEADDSTYLDLKKVHSLVIKKPAVKLILQYRIALIAAMFLLPLIGAFTTYQFMHKDLSAKVETEFVECFAPNGQRKRVTLPDGSIAWLNSNSLLVYSKNFAGNVRSIFLNGEANFSVVKNPKKPFIVKTNYMDVEALGTVFNVHSYSDSETITATLERGKIKVDTKNGLQKTILLKPNEQAIYNYQLKTLSINSVNADMLSRWKTGALIFKGATFDQIIKTIERHFNVTVNYEPNKYAERHFTVKFRPEEKLPEVMGVLEEMIAGLKCKIKGDIVYVN